MASGSGARARAAATPGISGTFASPNLTSNREVFRSSCALEQHPTISKTTGSEPQQDTAILHVFPTLIYCLIQVYAISQSILLSISIHVFDYFSNKSSKLHNQHSRDLDSIGHGSLESEQPCEAAADISPWGPRDLNDRPDVPTPEDKDEDDHDSCSPGGADGNINDQKSETEEDELAQVKENSKQLGNTPAANGHDAATTLGPQTPIKSSTSGEGSALTGETLIGSGSVTKTRLPDFSGEAPALEHKEKACHHNPPEEVPASEIPKLCTFYNDLGWVSDDRPQKSGNGALLTKLESSFSKRDNRWGILYILKHKHYTNLYKVGTTTSLMEERKWRHPLCLQTNAEYPPFLQTNAKDDAKDDAKECYKTNEFVGAPRAESLVKSHMARRNVPLKLCLVCRIGKPAKRSAKKQTDAAKQAVDAAKQSTAHTEWFVGDFNDIKACVDYWKETVENSYDKTAAFTGNVKEILGAVTSSERRRRQSRQAPVESKEHLNNPGPSPTPCPQRTEAERPPSTSSIGPEDDEETDTPKEVVRKRLRKRPDYTPADVGATPEKKAARRGGPQTRSMTKLGGLNTIPPSAQDKRRDYTPADVGATPEKKAARTGWSNAAGPRVRTEGPQTRSMTKLKELNAAGPRVRTEGPQTRSMTKLKELNTVPLSAQDILRVMA